MLGKIEDVLLLLMKAAWSKEVKCGEGLWTLVVPVIPSCCLIERCVVKEFHNRA